MKLPVKPKNLLRSADIARLIVRHWDDGWFGGDASVDPEAEPKRSLADDLEAMGPTFIKLGQMLATRPDVAPPAVRADLARLNDSVEPADFDDIRSRIEEELGTGVRTLFGSFEERPIGSASLAQVHRATLRDGRPVVVKVLRPGTLERVEKDLAMLDDMVQWLEENSQLEERYGLASTLREFDRALRRELDYRQEAMCLRRVAEITASYDLIRVPGVVDDYSSAHVLTMEYLPGTNVGDVTPVMQVGMDCSPAMRQLFRAYLDQALVHGFVHADPHPGNLIVMDGGQIGLIDLGMITVVPESMRSELVQMALAAAEGDGTAAARVAERMGEPLEGFRRDEFGSRVSTELALNGAASVGTARLGSALLSVTRVAGECGLRVPSSLALLGKTLLNLEQVGSILDPDFNPGKEFERYAPRLITARTVDEVDAAAVMRKALEAKGFIENLPNRIDHILDRLGDGTFQVHFRVSGEENIVGGLARVANRVAQALVLAALIVGASLLVRVETSFQIFGYPGLAIVLFTLAVLGGAHLLWKIARDDAEP